MNHATAKPDTHSTGRQIAGWLSLVVFVEAGYAPAMFCRDLILIGYTAPANHAEVARQITLLLLAVLCYTAYMGFATWVMSDVASRKIPARTGMSRDEAHELNNRRFFFTLIPSFVLIAGMAMWDWFTMIPLPGSDAVYRLTVRFVGLIV